MLGDHVLLEQMMMDSLLSDMGSCLQVFQHHPDLKDRCFELFLLTSEKKDCLYWERLCCILGTNKRLLYWET